MLIVTTPVYMEVIAPEPEPPTEPDIEVEESSSDEEEPPPKPEPNLKFIIPFSLALILAIAPFGNTLLLTEIDELDYDVIETDE